MRIRGQELDIDFIEELDMYTFDKVRIRDNKLQSCSPFRPDTKPSFAVNLENGTWIDSGADFDHMKKGNFVSLLALLRDTDYEEVEDYLIDKYGIKYDNADDLDLKLHLDLNIEDNAEFNGDMFYIYSRYLDKIRGIDDHIQRLFNTTQEVIDGIECVGIGWCNMHGRLINIKYRGIHDKKFWYAKNGKPIKNHLFGMDLYIKHRTPELWIVEGEIDAMYLWTLGKRAVALGRGSVNDKQLDLLKVCGAETIVIATDNDKVGKAVGQVIKDELKMYFNIKQFKHPEGIKDVNELPCDCVLDDLVEDIPDTLLGDLI